MPRKPHAKPPQSPPAGALTAKEKQTLVLIARDAYRHQAGLGNLTPETTPDSFRHAEMYAHFGGGVSTLQRADWRRAAAHFFTLAGKPEKALEMLTRSGQKSYRPAGPRDTWESCDSIVATMRQELASHASADLPPGMSPIREAWLVVAARQRTRKPTLSMESMAERLDPKTLVGLLSHLRHHIAIREGRPPSSRTARTYPPRPPIF